MTEPVFLIGLAIVGGTIVMVAKTIAGAIRGRGSSRSELSQMSDQLERQAAALEDTQQGLSSQSAQLAELQERMDFAERLLTQGRERTGLGPGEAS